MSDEQAKGLRLGPGVVTEAGVSGKTGKGHRPSTAPSPPEPPLGSRASSDADIPPPMRQGHPWEKEVRDPRFAELDKLIAADKRGLRTGRGEDPPRTAKTTRKPTKQRPSRPLPRDYRREISRVAREHRRKYQPLFAADPKLKDRAGRFYRSLLPPKPRRRGRPPLGTVSKAIRLLKKFRRQYPDERPEEHWARLYPLVIPGYGEMSDMERRDERERLRERVRWRRRRRHRTNKVNRPG